MYNSNRGCATTADTVTVKETSQLEQAQMQVYQAIGRVTEIGQKVGRIADGVIGPLAECDSKVSDSPGPSGRIPQLMDSLQSLHIAIGSLESQVARLDAL